MLLQYQLYTTDFIIIAIYFVVISAVGLYFSKKGSSIDYFLAGRGIGWFAIGASLFASNISSEHLIGLASAGFKSGLAVGHYEWMAGIVLMLLAWVFAPFYLRNRVFTMPEFIGKRYGNISKWFLAVVSIVAYILTKVSIALLGGALLLEEMFGWDMYTSALIFILFTGIYTVAGGLRSVIYTEVLQMFILIAGTITLTFFGLAEVGGISGLVEKAPPEFFSMLKPHSHEEYPWTGVIFAIPIMGMWYWCTDQFIVQRVLSAKNIETARTGALIAGFLKILPVFLLIMPGIIARVLFPEMEDASQAFPKLVTEVMPTGFRGIVIASLLAALMSSLASCFNSSSTIFTLDIYKKLYPDASEFHLVNVGRFATFAIVIFSILWIPFIKKLAEGQLWNYLQMVQSYIAPPVVVIFLLGIIWSRANYIASIVTLIVGFSISAFRFSLVIFYDDLVVGSWLYKFASVNFLHYATLLFILCAIVNIGVSLFTPAPRQAQLNGLTMKYASLYEKEGVDQDFFRDRPRWKRLNIAITILLLFTLLSLWVTFA